MRLAMRLPAKKPGETIANDLDPREGEVQHLRAPARAVEVRLPRLMHHHVAGRPVWVPNTHDAWPLRSAELLRCTDGLVSAAGLPGVTDRPPESVLWSPGVRTWFGRPRR